LAVALVVIHWVNMTAMDELAKDVDHNCAELWINDDQWIFSQLVMVI
jgi:hypothetical protein